jgi:hypothetical protein
MPYRRLNALAMTALVSGRLEMRAADRLPVPRESPRGAREGRHARKGRRDVLAGKLGRAGDIRSGAAYAAASPARISPRSFAGVTGIASILTPKGRRASSIAAQTAGGAPIRPPSPPPLMPYSV